MSDKIQLTAARRGTTGKEVRHLRKEGLIPAVLYGPDREPMTLQVEARPLLTTLARAGGSQIIDLSVEGESYPALVREVQRDNLRGDVLHVDFYGVSMDRPIQAEIPLHFVGEPQLVTTGEAVLITGVNSVEVQCLPADLPPSITVDLTALVDMDTTIAVRDLVVPPGVTVLTPHDELVATLTYTETGEVEELVEVDAEAVEVIRKGKEEEEEGEA